MATIQIRDLPEDTVEIFESRAARKGQSVEDYVRDLLIAAASKPTKEELLAEIRADHRADLPDLPLEETLRGIDEAWE